MAVLHHMRPTVLYILICVVLCFNSATAENAGLKIKLNQRGLKYGLKVGIDVLSSHVKGTHLPDVSGTKNIGVGHVSYKVSGMKIRDFGRPSGSIQVHPGRDMSVSLSGGSISLQGDWSYALKVIFTIRDHGTFDVHATGISVTLSFSLGKTSKGEPDIRSTGCKSGVSHLSVKFHGGASWLYNLFSGAIANPIRDAMSKVLCEQARKAIDVSAREHLKTLPISILIENKLDLNYELVQKPAFGQGCVQTFHKGEFFWHGDTTEAPITPEALPSPPQGEGMVELAVSSYVPNTLGHVLHQHGLIQYNLTKNELPAGKRDMLNTTCTSICIGKMIPQLQKYPGKSVQINMKATEDPKVTIVPGNVLVNFVGTFQYYLDMGKYLFTTSINATVNGTGTFAGDKITAEVSNINTDLKVTKSAIGNISDDSVNFLFKAASTFIIPKLNEFGQKGLKIPTIKDIQFQNGKTKMLQDVIFVSMDVHYKEDSTLYYEQI